MLHPKYRSDIDGLRAVAILAVVGYHAFPRWIHGGYVGVDVFFVISGYLISAILYSNFDKGSFSYVDFYSRRIRRIFPALVVLFAGLAAAASVLLLEQEYRELGKHMAASAGFVSNFLLWSEAGYFDPAAINKPLLHLWSLAIEEQFYLVWPLIVGISWAGRSRFILVVCVAGALSLAANFYLAGTDPAADFYSPLPRFWELMIGGSLAFAARSRPEGARRLANWESIAGAVLVAASVMLLRDSVTYPGYWALLPTLGTALLISAGAQGWVNRTLLSLPPARWIGLISYPMYLWHWPLLSLGHTYGIIDGPGKAVLMAVATVLAWLTWKFVETPLRASKAPATVIGLLCAVMLLGAAGYLTYAGILPAPSSGPFTKLELAQTEHEEYPGAPFNGTSIAAVRLPGMTGQTVLFSGDSHMDQYFPAVKALYAADRPRPFYTAAFVSHAHCLPSPNSAIMGEDAGSPPISCNALFAAVMRMAMQPDTKKIVFGGYWGINEAYTTQSLQSFGEAIRQLTASGKEVFVLLDNPGGEIFDPTVIMRMQRLGARFGRATNVISENRDVPSDGLRRKTEADQSRFRATALANGAKLIDPYVFLCPHDRCPVLIDGNPTHRDDNHLRPFYAREYTAALFRGLLGQ